MIKGVKKLARRVRAPLQGLEIGGKLLGKYEEIRHTNKVVVVYINLFI